MVRLGRFELPTSCFGGTRSIHLSYSRVLPLYHAFRLARIPAQFFLLAELIEWRPHIRSQKLTQK